MNIENLIGDMVLGSLGGRKKRSRNAARFLRGGRGSFINASSLLTLGGLAWGMFETMQQQKASGQQPPPAGGPTPAGPWPPAASGVTPPPGRALPPPLPGAAPAGPPAEATPTADVPEGALRIVRLMLSAARADGSLTDAERETILAQARAAGVEHVVERELSHPTPLTSIVQGITEQKQREDLYVLAFSIARADESITGAERIYLAQLAAQLGLDAATTSRLEDEAAARIDQAEDLGGA
ncbi:MAG: DUF533 domain-containing protein [Acidobacteria bacterium]|nr:MAG: DUF533 domain-containing protein [Acidobacteriota bacterium]